LLAALGEILSVRIIGRARVITREQQNFQRRRRAGVAPGRGERDAEDDDAVEQRRQEQSGGQPIVDGRLALLQIAGE
jgi:hypothetical protein